MRLPHLFHCWHTVPRSERKVKAETRPRCKKASPYINRGYYILYTVVKKCCICDQVVRFGPYRDYEPMRAKKYKAEGE